MCIFTLGLLSGADLHVPLTYSGDGLEYNLMTKTMVETGWFLENPRVGLPGSLELYDYPVGNNLDFIVMKIISLFTGEFGLIINIYYILTFYLTAVFALYVLRRLNIEYPIAVTGSLLFTFLYYHFARIGHFNLTAYYLIPIAAYMIIRIACGGQFWVKENGSKITLSFTCLNVLAILMLFLLASNSYYAFFAILLFILAALWSFSNTKRYVVLINGAIAVVLTGIGCIINQLPSFLYQLNNGVSFVLSYRYPFETEEYGLKLIQLLLPAPGHRVELLSNISSLYAENFPLVNENVTSTLGIIGSIGLLFLLLWVFIRNFKVKDNEFLKYYDIFDALTVLTIGSIFIGTIGGISAIIGQVFPTIHAYNRISLYIAFFAITAIMLLFQIIYQKYLNKANIFPIFTVLMLVLLLFGIFDQVPEKFVLVPNSDRELSFYADEQYFSQIESIMPEGAEIFMLPDVWGFPHSNPPGNISSLDGVKPYLHTNDLKWSYPTMKGRFWDNWQAALSLSPTDLILETLAKTGFSGILVDEYGYTPDGSISIEINKLTGIDPIKSNDGRYSFFDLTPYIKEKYGDMNAEDFDAAVTDYLLQFKKVPEFSNQTFAEDLRQSRIAEN